MKKNAFYLPLIFVGFLALSLILSQDSPSQSQENKNTEQKNKKQESAQFIEIKPQENILPTPSVPKIPILPTPSPPPVITPTPTPISPYELHIYFTGNRKSEIESCGCKKAKNLGGINYEIGFYQKKKEEKVSFVTLDSGAFIDIFINPVEKVKSEYLLKALEALPFDAINVSGDDFGIGLDFIKQFRDHNKINFLSANIVNKDGKEIFEPYHIFEVSLSDKYPKLKVGVVGVSQSPTPTPKPYYSRPVVVDQSKTRPYAQPIIKLSPQNAPTPSFGQGKNEPPHYTDSTGFDVNPYVMRQYESQEMMKKKEEIKKATEEFNRRNQRQIMQYQAPAPPPIHSTETNYKPPSSTAPPLQRNLNTDKPDSKEINMERNIPNNKRLVFLKNLFKPLGGQDFQIEEVQRFGKGGSGDPENKEESREYKVLPEMEQLKIIVPQLREKCDIVVVLAYVGLQNAKKIPQEIPGIDILVSGGPGGIINTPNLEGQTYLVHSGYLGKYIGELSLGFERTQDDKWKLIKVCGDKIEIYSDTLPKDKQVSELLVEYKNAAKEAIKTPVRHLNTPSAVPTPYPE